MDDTARAPGCCATHCTVSVPARQIDWRDSAYFEPRVRRGSSRLSVSVSPCVRTGSCRATGQYARPQRRGERKHVHEHNNLTQSRESSRDTGIDSSIPDRACSGSHARLPVQIDSAQLKSRQPTTSVSCAVRPGRRGTDHPRRLCGAPPRVRFWAGRCRCWAAKRAAKPTSPEMPSDQSGG